MKQKAKRFTRREEEIMDIIYRRGEASVSDLMEHLPGAPTAGAMRRLLNILYGKGAITYRHDGARKIYRASVDKSKAGTKALAHVVDTFFAGSAAHTMGALFNSSKAVLSAQEKKVLEKLIKKAKEREK